FNTGHDIRLDLSNPAAAITYHGPSGYSAYFARNTSGGYKDAPALNATLSPDGSGYKLTFHKSGEVLGFGSNSHLQYIKDKNGNQITLAYNSSLDVVSITDTQGRVFSLYVNIKTSPLDKGPEQAVHLLERTVEHAEERLFFPPGSTD
ncbi:MAG: hypothetical protein H0U76_08095, partial [Ktedonobacteraceae bacterium]|nr:hypothetical protein [Ktedonobacteraceae bacterium]